MSDSDDTKRKIQALVDEFAPQRFEMNLPETQRRRAKLVCELAEGFLDRGTEIEGLMRWRFQARAASRILAIGEPLASEVIRMAEHRQWPGGEVLAADVQAWASGWSARLQDVRHLLKQQGN